MLRTCASPSGAWHGKMALKLCGIARITLRYPRFIRRYKCFHDLMLDNSYVYIFL